MLSDIAVASSRQPCQAQPIADAGLFVSDDVAQFEYYRAQGHFQGWPAPHASVGQALESGADGYY